MYYNGVLLDGGLNLKGSEIFRNSDFYLSYLKNKAKTDRIYTVNFTAIIKIQRF